MTVAAIALILFHVRDYLNAFKFQITELSPEHVFNIGVPNEGRWRGGTNSYSR
jgi:hypothetical protein